MGKKEMSGVVKLQVALDFTDLHRALQLAEEAVRGGADWLEVGTPLIKSEGLEAVRAVKKKFPRHLLVADLKTMDTGALEVEMAAKAGADLAIILSAADDTTIREAVEVGRRYGAKIMVDLIGEEDMVTRAVALERLGVDYVCIHVGIDQQMHGLNPISVLKKAVKAVRVPIAVAGGLNSKSAVEAAKAGAQIIIVGGAITKAEDAAEATRLLKKAIRSQRAILTGRYRKYGETDLSHVFREVSTPNISDGMQRKQGMEGIHPITPNVKAVGRALTVRTYPGDWAKPVEAIDLAEPGQVIVIDAGGSGGRAVWGELATYSCIMKKVNGVVIDGAIRDVDVIRQLKFPAYAREVKPEAGDPKGLGEINVEITCGGVQIRPGDWIVGDDNGVIVIPQQDAVEMANRAKDIFEKEERVRAEIKKGSTLAKVLSLKRWEKIIG